MRKNRVIAIHLPQFHPFKENNEWWGNGFTEWANVAKARPRYRGHYEPHLPSDTGFYDLRLPESRQLQAELAEEYGIDGFAESAQKVPGNCPETAQKLPRSCPEVAQKTYEAICTNPKSSISELSEETGLSERTIKNHLKLLKDLNIIERIGSDINGYWKIIIK